MTSAKTISNQCDLTPAAMGVMKANRAEKFFASVSDIHLAHPRTNTYHIIESLRQAFPDNAETGKLDIIFFAGDVFDRLMNLPQDEVDAIQEWIADFLKICVKWNILVRVLEGTPSHDWHQSKQFVNVNSALEIQANLKYVETLSIEVINELGGMSVLYVPDEWNADASVTWGQVQELLSIHGMQKVDIACMHGSFDYQLPIQSPKNHNSENYQSIVRHYITIGHVHIRSENGIILAQGSLDRLSHGEEAAKGHYRACISPEGNYHWFVENTNAKIYKTLDCRELELTEVFETMEEMENFPDGSYFRLLIKRDSVVHHGLKDLRKRFPQFTITTQMDELKRAEDAHLLQAYDQSTIVKPITITPTNVWQVLDEHMRKKYPDTPANQVQSLSKVLEKYK